MTAGHRQVAVIIAAWNAAGTIGRAISSALAEDEVGEVIVVDDYSTDNTAQVAAAADDGSGRLKLLSQDANRGPAAARNLALRHSAAEYVAVLDSDDFLLPGRFRALFEIRGWDVVADNIAFIDVRQLPMGEVSVPEFDPQPVAIDLCEFIEGNISRPGKPRAELGFIKPVVRRAFLEQAGLSYDESLRLGEDFALYCQLLAAGARMIRSRSCGYVAVERPDSLSGRHSTGDLEALLAFDDRFARTATLDARARGALARHRRQLLSNVHHRQVIDRRRRQGLIGAAAASIARPLLLPGLARSVVRDKLARSASGGGEVRYLFSCGAPPLVSVIMPTFNAEHYVAAAIKSALAQTCRDVEVIIVDDASADRTVSIVERLAAVDRRIRVERFKANAGPGAARNRAIELANGRWVAVMDSDDLMEPTRLEKLIATAEREGADAISDNLIQFDGDDVANGRPYLRHPNEGWVTAQAYLREGRLFEGGADYGFLKPMFRRDRLEALKLRYNEQLRIAEDDDLVVRGLLAGMKYWLEPEALYLYRKHHSSTSHRLSVANARAMTQASAAVVGAASASGDVARLLRRRHAALERGLAFVCLIEALKSRNAGRALAIAGRRPAALRLLRMPLRAAFERQLARVGGKAVDAR